MKEKVNIWNLKQERALEDELHVKGVITKKKLRGDVFDKGEYVVITPSQPVLKSYEITRTGDIGSATQTTGGNVITMEDSNAVYSTNGREFFFKIKSEGAFNRTGCSSPDGAGFHTAIDIRNTNDVWDFENNGFISCLASCGGTPDDYFYESSIVEKNTDDPVLIRNYRNEPNTSTQCASEGFGGTGLKLTMTVWVFGDITVIGNDADYTLTQIGGPGA